MTSARDSAAVIYRGCRSCPEVVWIRLKWKFAIDRFGTFHYCCAFFRQHPVSAPAETGAVVP
jgi:hypothetical protein